MGTRGLSNHKLMQTFARLAQAAKEDRLKAVEAVCAATGQYRMVLVLVADTNAIRWEHEPIGHLVDNPMQEYLRPVWADKPETARETPLRYRPPT